MDEETKLKLRKLAIAALQEVKEEEQGECKLGIGNPPRKKNSE